MRHIYTLLLYLIAPLVVLRLLWRGLRSPAYWRRWKERFGYLPFEVEGRSIWIHAVSVGEVQATTPLVNALRERYPGYALVVTTTTPTGSERITAALGDAVRHAYLCYDTPAMVHRFLERLHPAIAIIMENEIWPNLYDQCARRGIPLIIANGRLSPRSASRYRRIPGLFGGTLDHVAAVAAQSELDAGRFAAIGMDPSRIRVTGNIKFDVKLPVSLREQAAVIRRQWGVNRSVWIAASTHEGEEEIVLRAFRRVREALPDALLVLVPRHPERFAKVAALCRRHRFATVLRSEHRPCSEETAVFLGDSMGELVVFYAAADVAFVGGTLVPVGGHNILEPALLGIPVVTGPDFHNFVEITQKLGAAGACRQIEDEHQLADTVIELLKDADARFAMGERGRRIVADNRGALEAVLELIEGHLGPGSPQRREAEATAVNER